MISDLWSEPSNGLLTVSRRPSKRWAATANFAHPLVLSSAALFELILWVPKEFDTSIPESLQAEIQELLTSYRDFFKSPSGELSTRTIEIVELHIQSQEQTLYSALEKTPFLDRAIRELRYEHQGLLRGLPHLLKAQEAALEERLEKRDKDKLDLDFFHLLEHHLEREIEALYPAWFFLTQG